MDEDSPEDINAQVAACEALLDHAPAAEGEGAISVYATTRVVQDAQYIESPAEAALAPGDRTDADGKTHRQAAEERLSAIVVRGKNAAAVRASRALLKRTLKRAPSPVRPVIVWRGVEMVPAGAFVLRATSAYELGRARAT